MKRSSRNCPAQRLALEDVHWQNLIYTALAIVLGGNALFALAVLGTLQ